MIYLLAVFIPPLALVLNGQPVSAVLNLVLIVPCIFLGLIFPMLFLIPRSTPWSPSRWSATPASTASW